MSTRKTSKRKVYHVTYSKDHWVVKEKGATKKLSFDKKQDAVNKGKKLAKSQPLGQIVIHKRDNRIQTEYTYGRDPRSRPG